jgi:YHS domain-containing protein
MKPNGGCYEPSLEVRKMAVEAIKVCGVPCHYAPYVASPEVGPEPLEEGGESKSSEPVPPQKSEEPPVKPTPDAASSVIPKLSEICIVSLKCGDYRRADPSISSEYRGRIYHFSSADARAQFDAAPEKFAVAFGGCDPVAYVQSGSIEDGRFLISHAGRFYMFSTAENAAKFRATPDRFLPAGGGNSEVAAR